MNDARQDLCDEECEGDADKVNRGYRAGCGQVQYHRSAAAADNQLWKEPLNAGLALHAPDDVIVPGVKCTGLSLDAWDRVHCVAGGSGQS